MRESASGLSTGAASVPNDGASSPDKRSRNWPISLKLIRPTPTRILVNQSETCSVLVLVTREELVLTSGLTLGTANRKPIRAPMAMHIIAQRHAVARCPGMPITMARKPAQFDMSNRPATKRIASSVFTQIDCKEAFLSYAEVAVSDAPGFCKR